MIVRGKSTVIPKESNRYSVRRENVAVNRRKQHAWRRSARGERTCGMSAIVGGKQFQRHNVPQK